MPTAPQSPAATASAGAPRHRITDTVAAVEALALAHVAHAGDRVCARFATRQGIVAITLPLGSWLAARHARCDGNGNFWPAAPATERIEAQLAADAAQVPAWRKRPATLPTGDDPEIPAPAPRRGNYRRADPAAVERYRAAWRRYTTSPGLSVRDLAESIGVSPVTLHAWFRRFRAEPGAPVLKPKGKL